MLHEGFRKIFLGLLLIFLEIHIIAIDILPDPVGYYLIYLGIKLINTHNGLSNKEKVVYFAFCLPLLSIPTMFLQNVSMDQMGNGAIFSGWSIYMEIIGILNLVLAFFIFQLLISVATRKGNSLLLKRTTNTFKAYLITMLMVTFFQSFVMNMSRDLLTGYTIVAVIISLIMQITFLMLVFKFSKLSDDFTSTTV